MPLQSPWPNFLVIGSPRSGTTTLHECLNSAPSICMSRIKEPKFFNRSIDFSSHFTGAIASDEEYLRLWEGCSPTQRRGEVTPTYFHDPASPAVIHATIPDVKLVVSLRNPVDRAVSHYNFKEKSTGRSDVSLEQAIDLAKTSLPGDYEHGYLLEPGFYGRHLERWLEFFTTQQMRIIVFEKLVADFRAEMEGLFHFIGIPPEEVHIPESNRANPSARPRSRLAARLMHAKRLRKLVVAVHAEYMAVRLARRLLVRKAAYPEASSKDRQRLYDIYQGDIIGFERLTGIRTGWLRE